MKLRVTTIILGVQISSDTIRQECIPFGGKVFAVNATYLYAFSDSHNAAKDCWVNYGPSVIGYECC